MTLVNWTPNLSVGIEAIDNQHKKILELINQTHAAMLEGRSSEEMADIMHGLIDYTETHFAYEEDLFKQYSYPETAQHQLAHTALTAKVLGYKRKLDAGETVVSVDILKFLKDWLIGHILGVDKRYAPFLKEHGVY